MEFQFLETEPINEEYNNNYECLTEAHNQMLFYIQDPNNRYEEMDLNPIDSKDVMYGIPNLFTDIQNEIKD